MRLTLPQHSWLFRELICDTPCLSGTGHSASTQAVMSFRKHSLLWRFLLLRQSVRVGLFPYHVWIGICYQEHAPTPYLLPRESNFILLIAYFKVTHKKGYVIFTGCSNQPYISLKNFFFLLTLEHIYFITNTSLTFHQMSICNIILKILNPYQISYSLDIKPEPLLKLFLPSQCRTARFNTVPASFIFEMTMQLLYLLKARVSCIKSAGHHFIRKYIFQIMSTPLRVQLVFFLMRRLT